jgi:hypothetical protein
MNGKERYEEYKKDAFDDVILMIKNGKIQSGKYANLVKIEKKKEIKGKEFFKHE